MTNKSIFTYFVLIIFSPIIGKLLKCIIDYYKSYKTFQKKVTLLEALSRITQREFEIWCTEYLSHLGFDNLVLLPIDIKNKNIIGNKSKDKYYIKCKKCTINTVINVDELEILLGSMICDNITYGLFISTGILSDEAKEFINNLKSPYKINVISSNELSCLYSDYILKIN